MTPPDGRDVAEAAVDLEGLERLAKAATAGAWHVTTCMDYWVQAGEVGIALCGDLDWLSGDGAVNSQDQMEQNARFIAAANPATVLHLIARARAASPTPATAGEPSPSLDSLRAIAADAARYRFLKEHYGSATGMTWEQPAECGIYWEWQQSRPDERFATFDDIIDLEIESFRKNEGECDGEITTENADAILALRTAPASSLEGGAASRVRDIATRAEKAGQSYVTVQTFDLLDLLTLAAADVRPQISDQEPKTDD